MFLFLASLAAAFEWVCGMCYTEVPDATPRTILFSTPFATSREACKQTGLTVSNCESVYFSPTKKMCYLFEKAGKNHMRGAVFKGCENDYRMYRNDGSFLKLNRSEYNPTVNYVADWCFNATGVFDPANLQAENAPICPNTPIDGEATARVYVVSLMLPNGGSIVLDNNMQAFLTWDRTNTTWVYKSQNGRDVYKNLPIYAASCAYFPTGTTGTTCPCNPLPLEYSTRSASGATPPTAADSGACPSGYSGIFIQANTNQQYTCSSPCSDFKLQCIGGLWIHTFQSGNGIDSLCYQ